MGRVTIREHLKLKPSRLVKKRKQASIFRLALWVIFLASLLIGVSFFSGAKFMTVDKVEILGLEALKEKQIKEIVDARISGRFLGLFSKANIFLYPKNKIKTEILAKYKRIAEAEVDLKDFSFIQISLKERHPFGLWCENEKCFYLDQTGYIFDVALNSENFGIVKYFGEVFGTKIGEYYLPPENFKRLYKFLGLLSSVLKNPAKEIRKDDSNIEILTQSNTLIKISLKNDLDKSFENITALLGDPEFQKAGKTIVDFQSIDARFGQKVLYKLK